MSTYAIGDIQGCYDDLQRLLELIEFNPKQDTLWFVGDLVNRGPKSLKVLRFIKSLGEHAIAVMGNHDLHLLAVAHGASKIKAKDTFNDILAAPDREELIQWLRQLPFLHYDSELEVILVHAGLPPQWNLAQARQYANEVETAVQGETQFFANMYGDKPKQWSEELRGWDRLRFISNCFTRLRYCDAEGNLDLQKKNSPTFDTNYKNIAQQPWFIWPNNRNTQIIFGHWAALGYHANHNVYALDSGCIWGGALTALRVEDKQVFSSPCTGACNPNDWL